MDRYRWGDCKANCDRCGFTFRASQLGKEWTGLRTCRGPGTNGCWEPRHPQEAVRGRADRQAPPWVRPEPEPIYVEQYEWNGSAWVSGSRSNWIIDNGYWNDGGEWVDSDVWQDAPNRGSV